MLQTEQWLHLVVGFNLQEKGRDHADSFLSADVALHKQTNLLIALYFSNKF